LTTLKTNFDSSAIFISTRFNNIDISLSTLKTNFDSSAIFISTRFNNIDISLSTLKSNFDSSAIFISTRFNNIDISLTTLKTNFDSSAIFITTKLGNIDISLTTLKTNFDSSAIIISTKFGNIDNSLNNVYTKLQIDSSFNNRLASISGDIIPVNDISYNLGSINKRWANAYIRDISATNISVSGNLLPLYNYSQVPVSFNTFALKNEGLLSQLGDASNIWISPNNYDISKNVLSRKSYIKMEFKVNYISSTEADQTLSFRVLKNRTNGRWGEDSAVVFTDLSLGSSMGVTSSSIYNGTFIDNLKGESIEDNNIYYKLEYMRNCPVGDSISENFGIQSGGNYIFLQELYIP
jgi:hypothetical protein